MMEGVMTDPAPKRKRCTLCGGLWPRTRFAKNTGNSRDGLRSRCKGCEAERSRAYRAKHKVPRSGGFPLAVLYDVAWYCEQWPRTRKEIEEYATRATGGSDTESARARRVDRINVALRALGVQMEPLYRWAADAPTYRVTREEIEMIPA